MTGRGKFAWAVFADLIVAVASVCGFVFSSHTANGTWLILVLGAVFLAICLAAFFESSAKRVWIHPLLIMSPEIVAFPIVFLTCRGFECGGIIGFLAFASAFDLILIGISYAVFYTKRAVVRRSNS
jgi:hypothetical protein